MNDEKNLAWPVYLVLLAVVALALMGVALWSTPWGNDLLHPVISFFVSLMHSAGGAQ